MDTQPAVDPVSPEKPEKTLFAKTAGGMFWMGLGTGGQTLIQFFVLVVVARLLTPEDFGIVTAAMIVVGLSIVLSMVGVGPALVQRPNLELRHVRSGFALSLIVGVGFYGLIYYSAPFVEKFFRMDDLADLLRILAIIFPIKSLGIVSEALLKRALKFRFLSITTAAAYAIGYGPIAIFLAVLEYGPYALVWAHIGAATVMTGILLIGRSHSLVPSFDGNAVRELLYLGSGFTVGQLGHYSATQADNFVVGRVIGATGLGIYGRAFQLMMAPVVIIVSVLHKVLFASLATIQNDQRRLLLAFRRGIKAVAFVMLPLSVYVVVFAEEIVFLILGEQWNDVVLPLQILSVGIFFQTGATISSSVAKATGAVYRRAWRLWLYAGGTVCFALVGSIWGIPGVALGVVGAIIINYFLLADLALRITNLGKIDFIGAHATGIVLGAVSFVFIVAAKFFLVPYVGGIITMVGAGVTISSLVLLLWRWLPNSALGEDGIWFRDQLRPYFSLLSPGRFNN